MNRYLPKLITTPLMQICLLVCVLLFAATHTSSSDTRNTPVYSYKVVNSYPHNTESFTQGLVFDDGTLYESTGLNGKSALMIVDFETGKTLKSHALADKYFGEGIAIVDERVIQLTWRAKKGFVYNKNSLELLKTFNYQTQGWGITYDGKYLVMSDGTDVLYYLDPKTYKLKGKLNVYDENGKVSRLNELEYIDGLIYANIWGEDRIAIIKPKTGQVSAWIDLSGLLKEKTARIDVLNGIAYNPDSKTLYVTGKLWPKLFEIEIVKEGK